MTAAPNWHDLDWEAVGDLIGLTSPFSRGEALTFQSDIYKRLTLTGENGKLTVSVAQLPGFKLLRGFTLNGSLESPIKVPLVQDGKK